MSSARGGQPCVPQPRSGGLGGGCQWSRPSASANRADRQLGLDVPFAPAQVGTPCAASGQGSCSTRGRVLALSLERATVHILSAAYEAMVEQNYGSKVMLTA